MVVYFPAVAPPEALAGLGVRMGSIAAVATVATTVERKFLLSLMSSSFVLGFTDSWVDDGAVNVTVDGDGCDEKAWVPARAPKSSRVLSFVMVEW